MSDVEELFVYRNDDRDEVELLRDSRRGLRLGCEIDMDKLAANIERIMMFALACDYVAAHEAGIHLPRHAYEHIGKWYPEKLFTMMYNGPVKR